MDNVADAISSAPEYSESLDDAVERLGKLSKGEYEQVRNDEAKALKVRSTFLDGAVNTARNDDKPNGLDLYEPEPWPDEVDGGDLLDRIVATIREYVILAEHEARASALWILHAHGFDGWQVTPRLAIRAPTPGAGKSVLLDVLGCMVPRALEAENLSPAVVFRAIEAYRPCLMVDEVDTFLRDNDELRGVLNSGHRKGGQVIRCEGDNHEIRVFNTFAPIATAGIGHLPGTLADRSIHIELQRKKPDESTREFRQDRIDHLRVLARQAARWMKDNRTTFRDSEPKMPEGIFNRKADNWRPLLAIADAAGGDWPERAREAAVALSTSDADNAESQKVQLLEDCRTILNDVPGDRIKTKELLSRLHDMEERPWGDYRRGKAINAQQLGGILRSFKILASARRFDDGSNVKGYLKADFIDVFARYLPYPPSSAVTASQVNGTAGFNGFAAVTPETDVTARKTPKAPDSMGCDGVTAEYPPQGQEGAKPVNSCVHCGQPIEADQETESYPDGEMHLRCYLDTVESAASKADDDWEF